jgi:hypothetical protein
MPCQDALNDFIDWFYSAKAGDTYVYARCTSLLEGKDEAAQAMRLVAGRVMKKAEEGELYLFQRAIGRPMPDSTAARKFDYICVKGRVPERLRATPVSGWNLRTDRVGPSPRRFAEQRA